MPTGTSRSGIRRILELRSGVHEQSGLDLDTLVTPATRSVASSAVSTRTIPLLRQIRLHSARIRSAGTSCRPVTTPSEIQILELQLDYAIKHELHDKVSLVEQALESARGFLSDATESEVSPAPAGGSVR